MSVNFPIPKKRIYRLTDVFVLLYVDQIRAKPIWNATFTDKLKQDLLLNYDKFARPAQHFNTTTVDLGMSVLHVELNEFKSTVSVHGWLHFVSIHTVYYNRNYIQRGTE